MINYIQGLMAPKDILVKFNKEVSALINNDTTGIDLKKVKGAKNLWRIKVDNKTRIFLTRTTDGNKLTWIFLKVFNDHNYNKALRAIESRLQILDVTLPINDDYELVESIESPPAPKTDLILSESSLRPLALINNTSVIYSDEQHEIIKNKDYPKIISGPAGSGKTLSTIGILAEIAAFNQNATKRPAVLYIAPNIRLIEETKKQWLSMINHDALNITFSTYEQWCIEKLKTLKNPACFISEQQFNDALTNAKCRFGTQLSSNIRYEFGLLAVIGSEAYKQLGEKQSYFTKKEDRNHIIDLFNKYKAYLLNNKLSDIGLIDKTNDESFEYICIDEAQQLPFMAFHNLQQQKMIISLDTHQCLLSAPLIFEHIRTGLMAANYKPNITFLSGTYRCGSRIANLANVFLKLERNIGEKEKTLSYTSIESVQKHHDHVLSVPDINKDNLSYFINACKNPDTVIITNVEGKQIEQLKKQLHTEQVLTVIESIGLTFKHVIFYQPLSDSLASKIEKKLKSSDKAPLTLKERTFINGLMVAVTRATHQVTIVEKSKDHYPGLYERMVEPYINKIDKPEPPAVENINDKDRILGWHERIKEHVLDGRIDVAKAVAMTNLGLTAKAAEELVNSFKIKQGIIIPKTPDKLIAFVIAHQNDSDIISEVVQSLFKTTPALLLVKLIKHNHKNEKNKHLALDIIWQSCHFHEQKLFIEALKPSSSFSEEESVIYRLTFLGRADCIDISQIYTLLKDIIQFIKHEDKIAKQIIELFLIAINNNKALLTTPFTDVTQTTLLNELAGTFLGQKILPCLSPDNQQIIEDDLLTGYPIPELAFWKFFKSENDILILSSLIKKYGFSTQKLYQLLSKSNALAYPEVKLRIEQCTTSVQFFSYLGFINNYVPETPPKAVIEEWLSELSIDENQKSEAGIETDINFMNIAKPIAASHSSELISMIAHMRFAVFQHIKNEPMLPKTAAHLIALKIADSFNLYSNMPSPIDIKIVSIQLQNGQNNWYIAINHSKLTPSLFNNKEPWGFWIDIRNKCILSDMPISNEEMAFKSSSKTIWPFDTNHPKQLSFLWLQVILPSVYLSTYTSFLTIDQISRFHPIIPLLIAGDWQNKPFKSNAVHEFNHDIDWPAWCQLISKTDELDNLLLDINMDTGHSLLSSMIRNTKYFKFLWCSLLSNHDFGKWFINSQLKHCCLDYNKEYISINRLISIQKKGYLVRKWFEDNSRDIKSSYREAIHQELVRPLSLVDEKLYGPSYPIVSDLYHEIQEIIENDKMKDYRIPKSAIPYLTQISNLELATNKGICLAHLLMKNELAIPLFTDKNTQYLSYDFLYATSYHYEDGNTPALYYLLTSPKYEKMRINIAHSSRENIAMIFHRLVIRPKLLEVEFNPDKKLRSSLLFAFTKNESALLLFIKFVDLLKQESKMSLFSKNNLLKSYLNNNTSYSICKTALFNMLSNPESTRMLIQLSSNQDFKDQLKDILLHDQSVAKLKAGLAEYLSASYVTNQFLDYISEEKKYALTKETIKLENIIYHFKRFRVFDLEEQQVTNDYSEVNYNEIIKINEDFKNISRKLLLTDDEAREFAQFISNAHDVVSKYVIHHGIVNNRYDLSMLILLMCRQFVEQDKKTSIELFRVLPNKYYIAINRLLIKPSSDLDGYFNSNFVIILDIQTLKVYTHKTLSDCPLIHEIRSGLSVTEIETGHQTLSRLYQYQYFDVVYSSLEKYINQLRHLELGYVGFILGDIAKPLDGQSDMTVNELKDISNGIINQGALSKLFNHINCEQMDLIMTASFEKLLSNSQSRKIIFSYAERSMTLSSWLINYAFSINANKKGAFLINSYDDGKKWLSDAIRKSISNSYFKDMIKQFVMSMIVEQPLKTSYFYISYFLEHDEVNNIFYYEDLAAFLYPAISESKTLFAKIDNTTTYFDLLLKNISLDNPIFYILLCQEGFMSAASDYMLSIKDKHKVNAMQQTNDTLLILAAVFIHSEKKARVIFNKYQSKPYEQLTSLNFHLTSPTHQLLDLLEQPKIGLTQEQIKPFFEDFKPSMITNIQDYSPMSMRYLTKIKTAIDKCKTHKALIMQQQDLLKNRSLELFATSLSKLMHAINSIDDTSLSHKSHQAILIAFSIRKYLGLFDRKQYISVISVGDDDLSYYIVIRGFQLMNINHQYYYLSRDCQVIDVENQIIMSGASFASNNELFANDGFAKKIITEIWQCWVVLDDLKSLVITTTLPAEVNGVIAFIENEIIKLNKLIKSKIPQDSTIKDKGKLSERGFFSLNVNQTDDKQEHLSSENIDVIK